MTNTFWKDIPHLQHRHEIVDVTFDTFTDAWILNLDGDMGAIMQNSAMDLADTGYIRNSFVNKSLSIV